MRGCLFVLVFIAVLCVALAAITTLVWNVVAGQFGLPLTTFWVTCCIYVLFFIVRGILKSTFRIKQ